MSRLRVVALTVLAMLAFAGNSLLCRLALRRTAIDPASFTSVRLVAGAVVLGLLVAITRRSAGYSSERSDAATQPTGLAGNWISAAALFLYAATFSFAFVVLPAATGALLVFGAVQVTMIGYGLATGERLRAIQTLGFVAALGGLVYLLLPGLAAPPLASSATMFVGGISWGVYSIRGKGSRNPIATTAGNFLRAAPMAVALSLALALVRQFAATHGTATFAFGTFAIPANGLLYAIASGAITSGIGYAIWYTALPALSRTTAASVQLTVPVIAALGGVIFLGEAITLRLFVAGAAILLGVLLVTLNSHSQSASQSLRSARARV